METDKTRFNGSAHVNFVEVGTALGNSEGWEFRGKGTLKSFHSHMEVMAGINIL